MRKSWPRRFKIGDVLRGNWISLAVLRQVAGRASWVAGVAFHVRGMLQPLWAAISDPHFGGGPNHLKCTGGCSSSSACASM
eukprot:3999232-Amphidinium_carterae.1